MTHPLKKSLVTLALALLPLFIPAAASAADGAGTAVIYFSQFDNVRPAEIERLRIERPAMVDGRTGASLTEPGLVGLAARWAASALGVRDVHPVIAREPYAALYPVCLERVEAERDSGARPALDDRTKAAAGAAASAGRIVLAVPNWGYTLPAPVRTFLEENAEAFAGKDVAPIVVHGTGGFAGTIDAMREDLPRARILEPLSLVRENVRGLREEVERHVRRLFPGTEPAAP